jgi:secernin
MVDSAEADGAILLGPHSPQATCQATGIGRLISTVHEVPPLSCDTFVAMPPTTADGVTLFGKNSDRHPWECQRLVLFPAAVHPAGASVRCQYIEVPQVQQTARVLGSQPAWLWGLEHGVNEHGVAIGNEMVVTREPAAPAGLLGMDIVRLGLERGHTAGDAVQIMIDLIEAHGQGGSGQPHVDWAYHNSFLVSDPERAWVLETSGRHWSTRAVDGHANISNHLSIGTDWDRIGADVAGFAKDQGWWREDQGDRFDFADAYRDVKSFPRYISEPRQRRGRELLGDGSGRLTNATLRSILRDHYEDGPVHRPGRATDDEHYFSLCMHAGSLQATTASMVVSLQRGDGPLVAWMALGTPCVTAYMPYYIDGELPPVVSTGGEDPSSGGLWWEFRELLTRVERDPETLAPQVRSYWDAVEAEVAARATQVEARAADLQARADREAVATLLTEFMQANARALATGVRTLIERVTAA